MTFINFYRRQYLTEDIEGTEGYQLGDLHANIFWIIPIPVRLAKFLMSYRNEENTDG